MRRFKRGLIFVTCFLLGFLSIVSTPQAQETKDVKVTASQISVNDLVTPSKPDELSDADKRNQLKILLRWPGSIPYRSYFVMLPKKINLNEIGNAEFNNITNSRSIKINPYSENKNDDTGIQFTVPQGFEKMPDTEGLCVVLDGIGRRVPVRAGETFAEYFAHGLVTRLVLGEYCLLYTSPSPRDS